MPTQQRLRAADEAEPGRARHPPAETGEQRAARFPPHEAGFGGDPGLRLGALTGDLTVACR
jgi:hypothetical protein